MYSHLFFFVQAALNRATCTFDNQQNWLIFSVHFLDVCVGESTKCCVSREVISRRSGRKQVAGIFPRARARILPADSKDLNLREARGKLRNLFRVFCQGPFSFPKPLFLGSLLSIMEPFVLKMLNPVQILWEQGGSWCFPSVQNDAFIQPSAERQMQKGKDADFCFALFPSVLLDMQKYQTFFLYQPPVPKPRSCQ